MKEAHLDFFAKTLISVVLEFDKGNYPGELKTAWKAAIDPGIRYFREKLRSHFLQSPRSRTKRKGTATE